jgi:hypothetical protein
MYIARFATPPKHPKPQEIIKTDWKSETLSHPLVSAISIDQGFFSRLGKNTGR